MEVNEHPRRHMHLKQPDQEIQSLLFTTCKIYVQLQTHIRNISSLSDINLTEG